MNKKRDNVFFPSFPRRRESILVARKMGSHLRGNDEAIETSAAQTNGSPLRPLRSLRFNSYSSSSGFTLPELIIVIVLLGILAVGGVNIITGSINAYNDQATRAELVNTADNALRQMADDIRAALPNSVRLNGTTALQVINTVAGARYRDDPGKSGGVSVSGADSRLQFNKADDSFNILGQLLPDGSYSYSLVIYNTGQTGANAYAGDNITHDTVIHSGSFDVVNNNDASQLSLNAAHQFPFRSPGQRIYAVDGANTYYCNGGNLMMRFDATIPATVPTTGGTPVTGNVTNCQFTYNPGTATRAGLVTLRLTLTRNGESVTLMHQVHVVNVP